MKAFSLPLALTVLVAVPFLGACSPTIYVVDRHTVLEDEAAGEWPDFEKQMKTGSTQPLPVPFSKTAVNARRKRLYNVLDGELVPAEKQAKK